MKRFVGVAILLALVVWLAPVEGAVYKLYYLGGQSNMDGYGAVSELPEELKQPAGGVRIYQSSAEADNTPIDGAGKWSPLLPGHGRSFKSDGVTNTYSDRFGVELTLARRLRELDPTSYIAFIKYSKGGTSIYADAAGDFGCWEPDFDKGNGINQYDHFLATLRRALEVRDIDGDGTEDTLIPAGIVWMQGESDANDEAIAKQYEANLKRLMDLVRAALRVDDLPVVIGRISDSGQDADGKVWDYGRTVRRAQADFCAKDACAALVTSTDKYGYSDKWHYDTAGYIDLGIQFAEALHALQEKR
ncbi:MAG: hypothetical protein JSW27_13590 [Phycisphaerales bacterium]|nr:MAG: hypothetical protein JSW27_13590 [Phycisphaerales bacterium]